MLKNELAPVKATKLVKDQDNQFKTQVKIKVLESEEHDILTILVTNNQDPQFKANLPIKTRKF